MERKILGWENDQDENDLVASHQQMLVDFSRFLRLSNLLTNKNEEFWKKIG